MISPFDSTTLVTYKNKIFCQSENVFSILGIIPTKVNFPLEQNFQKFMVCANSWIFWLSTSRSWLPRRCLV